MSDNLPVVNPDERALILGKTGSGKTTGAAWLLSRSPGRWVILNSKYDPMLSQLGPSVKWDVGDIFKSLEDSRVVVAHPEVYDQRSLDETLFDLCETQESVGVMIDELLYLSKGNGQCGQGLISLLTRGRSRGQPMIGCTQRPSGVSQFAYTESTYYGIYNLKSDKDWQRVDDFTQRPDLKKVRQNHHWVWYDTNTDQYQEYGPVPYKDIVRRFTRKA